jgi:anti-sigma regulatory factor (Ser/Thr protein kinase)
VNDVIFKMSFTIPSDQAFLGWTKDLVSNALDNDACPVAREQGLAHRLTLATTEAVTNSIVHGNQNDGSPVVEVDLIITEKWIEIKVRDSGPGFKLDKVPQPDIEDCPTNGMGLHMIREIMTSVSLARREGKNELKMTKVL